MIRLLIKGTREDAARELLARGMGNPRIVSEDTRNWRSVSCLVEDAHIVRVAEWFVAPPREPPYPAGALLHYHSAAGELTRYPEWLPGERTPGEGKRG